MSLLPPPVKDEVSPVDPGMKSLANPASKKFVGSGDRSTGGAWASVVILKMLFVVFPVVDAPQSGELGRASPLSRTLPSSSK